MATIELTMRHTRHEGTGLSTDTKPSANYDDRIYETDTGYEYKCFGGDNWVKISTGGAASVFYAGDVSASEGDIRTAYAAAGASTGVVPNTDLSAVPASADIIAWTFTAGKKNAKFIVSRDFVGETAAAQGNTWLGWWVTVNAGSAVAALDRLREALDTAAGKEIAMYVAGATIDANENKASFIVSGDFEYTSGIGGIDLTDIYVMPITSAATARGNTLLTAIVV